jgi:PadR family transcriptional regulator, regulatory protein PadR
MHRRHRLRARNRSRGESGEWEVRARVERFGEAALLVSLAARPTHGYELIERLPELSGGDRVDVGNLYRTLRSLEDEGLVTSEWQPELPGPAKRTYTLTAEGHAVLASWLAAVEQLRDGLTMFLERSEKGGDHVRTTPQAEVE